MRKEQEWGKEERTEQHNFGEHTTQNSTGKTKTSIALNIITIIIMMTKTNIQGEERRENRKGEEGKESGKSRSVKKPSSTNWRVTTKNGPLYDDEKEKENNTTRGTSWGRRWAKMGNNRRHVDYRPEAKEEKKEREQRSVLSPFSLLSFFPDQTSAPKARMVHSVFLKDAWKEEEEVKALSSRRTKTLMA